MRRVQRIEPQFYHETNNVGFRFALPIYSSKPLNAKTCISMLNPTYILFEATVYFNNGYNLP